MASDMQGWSRLKDGCFILCISLILGALPMYWLCENVLLALYGEEVEGQIVGIEKVNLGTGSDDIDVEYCPEITFASPQSSTFYTLQIDGACESSPSDLPAPQTVVTVSVMPGYPETASWGTRFEVLWPNISTLLLLMIVVPFVWLGTYRVIRGGLEMFNVLLALSQMMSLEASGP